MPTDKSKAKFALAAFSFVGSFLGLTAFFIITMYRQFGAMDWPYLWFALIRISAISLGVGAVMYFANLPNRRYAVVLGGILGFAGALAYYYVVVAGT